MTFQSPRQSHSHHDPQVLLSKVYRAQALKLFVEFIDLGTWAVKLTLHLGSYDYILKLLNRFAATKAVC